MRDKKKTNLKKEKKEKKRKRKRKKEKKEKKGKEREKKEKKEKKRKRKRKKEKKEKKISSSKLDNITNSFLTIYPYRPIEIKSSRWHTVSTKSYVSFCWSPNTAVSKCMSPKENITYDFDLFQQHSPAYIAHFLWIDVAIQLLIIGCSFFSLFTQHPHVVTV